MPTLSQVRTRVDDRLAQLWTGFIKPRQETYYNAILTREIPVYDNDEESPTFGEQIGTREELYPRHQYWQGLVSHSIFPAHTTAADGDSIPDNLTVHPSDVPDNWVDFIPELDMSLPAAFQIDVYESPLTHVVEMDGGGKESRNWGYAATVWVRYNGDVYSRTANFGPEPERAVAWHRVVEDDTP